MGKLTFQGWPRIVSYLGGNFPQMRCNPNVQILIFASLALHILVTPDLRKVPHLTLTILGKPLLTFPSQIEPVRFVNKIYGNNCLVTEGVTYSQFCDFEAANRHVYSA